MSSPLANPLAGLDVRGSEPELSADVVAVTDSAARPVHTTREYRLLLGLILVVYIGLYGGLLIWTQGVPYVLDNNESFSTLWHAQNMAQQPFSVTFGLTDEVFSTDPAAHPYVHSHQGNFPRLFAFVLYVLGAHSIEAQIVLTTFTVGVISVVLLFYFFSVTASPRFAFVAACVFLSDYLFFGQWQVVTYRVWHGFFLFASLLCARAVTRSGQWRWLLVTGLVSVGLFYCELILVAFVALFSTLYAVAIGWRTPRRIFWFGFAQGVGGGLAMALLMVQLLAYLGWDGLREDFALTYVARNLATETVDTRQFSPWSLHDIQRMTGGTGESPPIDPVLRERLANFYEQRNLAFWWNVVDSRPLRQPAFIVGAVFVWALQFYTPFLVLMVGIVVSGWLLSDDVSNVTRYTSVRDGWRRRAFGGRTSRGWLKLRVSLVVDHQPREARTKPSSRRQLVSLLGLAATAGSAVVLLTTVMRDQAYLGLPLSSQSFAARIGLLRTLALLGAVVVGTFLASRWLLGSWRAVAALSPGRHLTASLYLLAVAVVVRSQPGYYDQQYAPMWYGAIAGQFPIWLSRTAVLLAAALGVGLMLRGRRAILGDDPASTFGWAVPYLVCGGIAYLTVYFLAAGFVLTGYLTRMLPMLVFLIDVLVAIAAMVIIVTAWRGLGAIRSRSPAAAAAPAPDPRRLETASMPRERVLAGITAGALLIFLTGYWLHTQRAYLTIFPPDQFTFLKSLSQPPFRGASFVVSTYAAPVAHYTEQWAYYDPLFSNGDIQLVNGVIRFHRDARSYVWFADRRTNDAYIMPDYYVCINTPSFRGALERLIGREPRSGRCSNISIVRRALSQDQEYMHFDLVARDTSQADVWAIVKLNWELLPYLRRGVASGSATAVAVALDGDTARRAVRVSYDYVDPEGSPERGSIVRLYEQRPDGSHQIVHQASDVRQVDLPLDFHGTLVVSVAPSTGERTGPEYFSPPLEVTP